MIDVTKTALEEIFGYNTKQSELKEVCKYITSTFIKPKYSSIPKEYYPFLYKLLSYRKFDYRGEYKEGDIRTFYVGNNMGNKSIAFFDNEGNHDFIGCTSALNEWQQEKKNKWEYMLNSVRNVLRNISKVAIDKKRSKLVFPTYSEISGSIILTKNDCDIDHYDDDFSKVAFDWMYTVKLNLEKLKRCSIDIVYELYRIIDDEKKYFKDSEWSKAFYDFHNSHTHLRVVLKKENKSRKKHYPDWNLLKNKSNIEYAIQELN